MSQGDNMNTDNNDAVTPRDILKLIGIALALFIGLIVIICGIVFPPVGVAILVITLLVTPNS